LLAALEFGDCARERNDIRIAPCFHSAFFLGRTAVAVIGLL